MLDGFFCNLGVHSWPISLHGGFDVCRTGDAIVPSPPSILTPGASCTSLFVDKSSRTESCFTWEDVA